MLPRRTSRGAELLRCRILLCDKKDGSLACMSARGVAIAMQHLSRACFPVGLSACSLSLFHSSVADSIYMQP